MAVLNVRQGEDWQPTMTFTVADVPTLVDDPVLEIREGQDSSFPLVLRCDETSHITQTVPGVLQFSVSAAVTQSLPAGNWFWDMFGVVDGVRTPLAPVDVANVIASVSLAVDPA